jgi:hypothetical protein
MVTLSYNGASSSATNAHALASNRSTENESHDDCSQINQIQPASVVDTMTPKRKKPKKKKKKQIKQTPHLKKCN